MRTTKARIRVLVTDRQRLCREGVCALLSHHADFDVVADTGEATDTVRLALDLRPDVILLDLDLPGTTCLDATKQILATRPNTKIIGLSAHTTAQRVSEILEAGASGFLHKTCSADDLMRAIDDAINGKTVLSTSVEVAVVKDHIRRLRAADHKGAAPELTPREREVVTLLAEGRRSKEAASVLGISVKTVESHRSQIMTKLGCGASQRLPSMRFAKVSRVLIDQGAAIGRQHSECGTFPIRHGPRKPSPSARWLDAV